MKTTYEYVVDLKERLQDTCELAHQQLMKAQTKQCKYFNRKTKSRSFITGDKVLVLLPTDSNKLLMQWQGPFEIMERVRGDDYKIRIKDRVRTYHANMLKKYYERKSDNSVAEESGGFRCKENVSELSAVILEANEDTDDQVELYKSEQTETYKDVQISSELSEAERKEVIELLEEFQDIFFRRGGFDYFG